MEIQEFIKKLSSFNIHVDVVADKLDIQAPKGIMTAELLDEIKQHKEALMAFINSYKHANIAIDSPIPLAPVQSSYVLSSSQRRLWLLSQIERRNSAYNMFNVHLLEGSLDVSALEHAFHTLISRHESLRTLFKENTSGVRQVILPLEEHSFRLHYRDISQHPNPLSIAHEIIQEETTFPFNLARDSLLRATLLKTAPNTHIFSCVMHHIISDGWSLQIMTNELFTLYDACQKGKPHPLSPLPLQYKDYAVWQQAQLQEETTATHKAYWIQQFKGEIPVLELPSYTPRPITKTYDGGSVKKIYEKKWLKPFNTLCQSRESTLFMGVLTAIKIILHRYTGQTDITIGSPIAGRIHPDLQNQIGFYVNTLTLRTQLNGQESFTTILSKVQEKTLNAYQHQHYPFDELIENINHKWDPSRNPLFDVMVTFQNMDRLNVNTQQLGELKVKTYETETTAVSSKFDLEFNVEETTEGLVLILTYDTAIYSETFARQLTTHLNILLQSIVTNPEAPVQSLTYLTEAEQKQLLRDFNNTSVAYPEDKTITDLFEAQVAKTPDRTAVIFEETTLTYNTLNEESNRLAAYLRENYTIQPDDLIGIKLDRSSRVIITILGILKSGAAYVPIDINYPEDRIRYMEKDSNSKVVIDENIWEDFTSTRENYATTNSPKSNQSNDLAYVIYTSGTTGNPKGVMVTHRNLVNSTLSRVNYYKINNILLISSYAFDSSVGVIWGGLISGGTLIIEHDFVLKDFKKITEKIIQKNVTDLLCVPSYYTHLLEALKEHKNEIALKNVILAGEQFQPDLITLHHEYLSTVQLYNEYGPTEGTVWATVAKLRDNKSHIPIGKPISNTQIYIVDETMSLVPIGQTGKLYISGKGIARGYLNNPELTAEKFIPNPFVKGSQMYATGDMARWLPDGNLEFMGRKDQQVKIRGYRIELGEIEQCILHYKSHIKQAVVIAGEVKKETVLMAYYVSPKALSKSELRNFLQEHLPDYMIPVYYIALDSMPLTPHGKIDRKALPPVKEEDLVRKEYIAPQNETEEKLTAIWQEVLNITQVGSTDNFFALGGNSLNLILLSNRIQETFHVQLKIADLFNHVLLTEQAKLIKNRPEQAPPITPVPQQENYPASKAQQRIWTASFDEEHSVAYNMPVAIRIQGALNTSLMEQALHTLIARHEILHTAVIVAHDGTLRQEILSEEEINFKLKIIPLAVSQDFEDAAIDRLVKENSNTPLAFSKGEVIRATVIQCSDNESLLHIVLHHIAGDEWSASILYSELLELYTAFVEDRKWHLPTLEIQYKDYATWEHKAIAKENIHSEFWKNAYKKPLEALSLPFDSTIPESGMAGTAHIETIETQRYQQLKTQIAAQQNSSLMLFTTLLYALMYKYTLNTDMVIGIPVAQRNTHRLQHQIGPYLNMMALRLELNPNTSLRQLMEVTKSKVLQALQHAVYPFEEVVGYMHPKTTNQIQIVLNIYNNTASKINTITHAAGLSFSMADTGYKSSKFPLCLYVIEDNDTIAIHFEYQTARFKPSTIVKMGQRFQKLIDIFLKGEEKPLKSIEFHEDIILPKLNRIAR
ncbi:MAG: amino acid adenylation domain-containing protein [Bacteroidota bacterium]